MPPPPLGALTIGQAPRPDLLDFLRGAFPRRRWLEAGALDDVPRGWQPPAVAGYPLRTRLRDGRTVLVDETLLAPRLQRALNRLEAGRAHPVLLLCAGTFATLQPHTSTLLHPFRLALSALAAAGCRRPLLLLPLPGQVEPSTARYRAAGLAAAGHAAALDPGDPAFTGGLAAALDAHGADGLLLDYIGHPPAQIAALAGLVDRPVFALDTLLLQALQRHLHGGTP